MSSSNALNTLFPIISLFLLLSLANVPCEAQLSSTFYDPACLNASALIRTSIRRAISCEHRMAASLIRFHFHDCFVQGCDALILLEQTDTIQSEKTAFPNVNSIRGYEVIGAAKREVERVCPEVVSCADIVTLAARDASIVVGGPSWNVRLGRRDSTTASHSQANTDLPKAHTIGQAHCFLFRSRINNNETDIDARFASMQRRQCPQTGGDANLAPLDLVTPNLFDNNYFKNLIQRKGLLQSDQVLFSGGSTDNIISEYSRNPRIFASDFANAMIKMGEIQPLVGRNGIIRRTCSAIN
ncbi:Lignin-forming anionic peroxidase [Sesamum alatum]|uniref:Peroxidase n=1 Tax=Sesamum alatum TaxID=300844 RepID=A0AAE1Y582_9LAMI|nr:Lignin-forming anionic peroxidase [Sesamum alatum]